MYDINIWGNLDGGRMGILCTAFATFFLSLQLIKNEIISNDKDGRRDPCPAKPFSPVSEKKRKKDFGTC